MPTVLQDWRIIDCPDCQPTPDSIYKGAFRLTSFGAIPVALVAPSYTWQSGQVAALIIKTESGNVFGISVSGAAQNSVVTLWDGVTAAAPSTIIWSTGQQAVGAGTTPYFIDLRGVPFVNGLTLAITGANSNAMVIWE